MRDRLALGSSLAAYAVAETKIAECAVVVAEEGFGDAEARSRGG